MSDAQSGARVVAITGASSGIGRAAAEYFAAKGWRVGLIARSEDNLDAARKAVVTAGGTASVAVADVADSKQLAAAADHIEAELGPIDVWVNKNPGAAGIGLGLGLIALALVASRPRARGVARGVEHTVESLKRRGTRLLRQV